MSLADFAAIRDLSLSSAALRLAAIAEAVGHGWTLNIYASEGHPAAEDVDFDDAEDAASVDVGLVYLTRAQS